LMMSARIMSPSRKDMEATGRQRREGDQVRRAEPRPGSTPTAEQEAEAEHRDPDDHFHEAHQRVAPSRRVDAARPEIGVETGQRKPQPEAENRAGAGFSPPVGT